MSAQQVIPDQSSRARALDISTSWAVTAPAGSGKTGLLTQRILKLLSVVDQPESLLAITFTRKAAGEMRSRILQHLVRAEDPDLPTDELEEHEKQSLILARQVLARDKSQDWDLLNNPNRLRIQTIDSFCRRLATSLPLESGVSLPPGVADDTGLLYQTAARRTLEYLESGHPIAEDLQFLLQHLSIGVEQLIELLSNLLSSRDSWLPIISQQNLSKDWVEAALEQLLQEKFEDARQAIKPVAAELGDLIDYALAQSGDALEDSLESSVIQQPGSSLSQELDAWGALANFLLQKGKAIALKSVNKSRGFIAGDLRKPEMQELLSRIAENPRLIRNLHSMRGLPRPGVSTEQWRLIESLAHILNISAAELRLLEQETGLCDHTEVTIAALRALGEPERPTPLAERMDYRIQHILVDEFQDTSSAQIQLIESLTAGWQPEDGRTLFIVGDAMQSIYEFRKANVELFIRVCRQGIQDIRFEPLGLVCNFRSRPNLVEQVNEIFSRTLGEAGANQQGFTQAVATRSTSDGEAIHFGCHQSESAEADSIAAHIKNLLAQGETDIAILVRSRNHLYQILPTLRKNQIRWQAQDIDPLNSRMAVLDIDTLTRSICCPGDRIAWLALLRTPWAGLDNADLLTLSQYSDNQDISLFDAINTANQLPEISSQGQTILNRLAGVLNSAFAHLGQVPLRWIIEQCWLDLGGPQGLLDNADLDNVQDYLNLVESQEAGGTIGDWEAFDLALKKLYARPVVSEIQPQIKIMTMHKAKGLEFDHVILPGLSKANSAGGPSPLLVWWEREFRDGELRFLLSPKAAKDSDNSLYSYLLEEQKERQLQEQLRILYVAMTRARESLMLSATFNFNEDNEPRAPGKNSLIYGVWETLKPAFTANASLESPDTTTEAAREISYIRRLPAQRESSVSLEKIDNLEQIDGGGLSQPEAIFSSRYMGRCIGDIVHQDLHQLDNRFGDHVLIDQLRDSWQRRLELRGLTAEKVSLAITQLDRIMSSVLASTIALWIFKPRKDSAAESAYEVLATGGQVRRYILDRTFVESGKRWIIDYKTSEPTANEDKEAFIQRELARYRDQLLGYEKIFSDHTVVKALYFPLLDELRELD